MTQEITKANETHKQTTTDPTQKHYQTFSHPNTYNTTNTNHTPSYSDTVEIKSKTHPTNNIPDTKMTVISNNINYRYQSRDYRLQKPTD